MKKNIYIYIVLLFTTIGSINAQDYFSFYNLGDYVAQTQNVSPVYLPKNSFTFGIANIGAHLGSNQKLGDILVPSGVGNNLEFNGTSLLAVADDENKLNSDVTVNIFMLSFKTKKGSWSIFANARQTTNWQYSKSFLGLTTGLNDFTLENDRMEINAYSEIGIGYTRKFLKDKLAVGLRLKTLNGIAHSSTDKNYKFGIDFEPDVWTVNASNATINTSGRSLIEDDSDEEEFSAFSDNKGFAFDIGAVYNLNEKLSFEIAVNDIGSITWKERLVNYVIEDNNGSTYDASGIDLDGSDVEQALEDALNDFIPSYEKSGEEAESFKTKLTSKIYLSAKYQLSKKNAVSATYFNSKNPFVNTKASYAIGFNRTLNKTTYGIVGSGGGVYDKFKFGANAVLRLGFLQLYAAVDNIASLSGKVEEEKGGNIRFGLNIVTGYNKWIAEKEHPIDVD